MSNSSSSEGSDKNESLGANGAIGILIVNIAIVVIYEFSLWLIMKMVKRNDLITGKLLGYYAKFSLIYTPFFVVLIPAVIELSPLPIILGHRFCDAITFGTHFGVYLEASFSFMVASTMYICYFHKI